MAASKKGKHRSLVQILALLTTVVIVIAVVYLAQTWWNNRPDPAPKDLRLTATAGERSEEIAPYMVCEVNTDCAEGEVPTLPIGEDDALTLDLPEPIYDHDWTLLTIYDDPAYNDTRNFGGNEQESVTIPGSLDPTEEGAPRPRLMVVEVNTALIDRDAEGNETPVAAVWSVGNSEVPTTDAESAEG
ncbi:DUF2771 domain-containing protein [Corynebacterium mastitidis]|uniref:DUF2771 domain-containing protein n=1 Tax=Corynebacterium mastitidis TaxID=161890 RepID=UPI001F328B2E|nr:DUF2771 domain-containing protein [Corynebacterium mastitidis]MCH6197716.1 DUF2771 domain-containing protein [Corynebacterium mastitidis]